MNEPCQQLWPNHPVPMWLQSPFVIALLLLIGLVHGWWAGVAFTHYYHYRFKEWLDRRDRT